MPVIAAASVQSSTVPMTLFVCLSIKTVKVKWPEQLTPKPVTMRSLGQESGTGHSIIECSQFARLSMVAQCVHTLKEKRLELRKLKSVDTVDRRLSLNLRSKARVRMAASMSTGLQQFYSFVLSFVIKMLNADGLCRWNASIRRL